MVKFTNNHDLPEPLARALANDSYSRGEANISVTGLISSPRMHLLKEIYAEDITIDVMDRLWAVFGTAVHNIIEKGAQGLADYTAEERLFAKVSGWIISGAVDLQHLPDGRCKLIDWKSTSAYAVQDLKSEWIAQTNLYRWLIESAGTPVVSMQVGAIIRDWSRAKALQDRTFPQTPIVMIDLPMWTMAEAFEYAHERVRLHQEAQRMQEWGDELPECTPEECWERGEAWAVMKPGGKRASRVLPTPQAAQEYASGLNGAVIEHRAGERIRCESYCEVSEFCSQWSKWRAEHVSSRNTDPV